MQSITIDLYTVCIFVLIVILILFKMECSKCIQEVDSGCKYLECTFCSGTYHFTCLNNVTDNEYEFVKSISIRKCNICKNIK